MTGPSCEYCGRCLSVCPSYRHYRVETMGPRARIDLANAVASGELIPGGRYAQSLRTCLQCLACTEICGKGVDGAQIILEARLAQGEGKKTVGRRAEKIFTTALLPRRRLMSKVVRICSFLQHIFPADPHKNIRHLPDVLTGFAGRRSLPVIARKSLYDLLPECIMPPEHLALCGEVALFSGCFGGLVNVRAGLGLIHALTERGYMVYLPKGQSCCGAPAQLSGFARDFEKIQDINAKAFANCGEMQVITLCATCHRTLAHEYRTPAGKDLARRIIDANVFLQRHDAKNPGGKTAPTLPAALHAARKGRDKSEPLFVAVHDPCHLRLDPEAGQALRARLSANPWLRLVELPDAGSCCGGGGVSSLKNPDLADELGQARAKAVVASGADVVVAQCPGCVLQLNNHLKRLKSHAIALHPMEL